jgi:hypothetical protein
LQRKSGWTNWRHNPIKDQTKAPLKRRGNLGRRSHLLQALRWCILTISATKNI